MCGGFRYREYLQMHSLLFIMDNSIEVEVDDLGNDN